MAGGGDGGGRAGRVVWRHAHGAASQAARQIPHAYSTAHPCQLVSYPRTHAVAEEHIGPGHELWQQHWQQGPATVGAVLTLTPHLHDRCNGRYSTSLSSIHSEVHRQGSTASMVTARCSPFAHCISEGMLSSGDSRMRAPLPGSSTASSWMPSGSEACHSRNREAEVPAGAKQTSDSRGCGRAVAGGCSAPAEPGGRGRKIQGLPMAL